jgi:predicted transcriptional regulator of viral defense system
MNNWKYTRDYLIWLQSRGRYTFSLQTALEETGKNYGALKRDLDRLKEKGVLVSIRKGFYVIVPPEYKSFGILPVVQFIDPLMTYLEKKYYIGLLSAAQLHGAAHQQPQEFFVITELPSLRDIYKSGIKINFSVKRNWSELGIIERKTDTGYVKISSPELTAIDLLIYLKRIGSINRIATVLAELVEEFRQSELKKVLHMGHPIAALQRLGYILEIVLDQGTNSEIIYNQLRKSRYSYIPLRPEVFEQEQFSRNRRWKIIENIVIETDL